MAMLKKLKKMWKDELGANDDVEKIQENVKRDNNTIWNSGIPVYKDEVFYMEMKK